MKGTEFMSTGTGYAVEIYRKRLYNRASAIGNTASCADKNIREQQGKGTEKQRTRSMQTFSAQHILQCFHRKTERRNGFQDRVEVECFRVVDFRFPQLQINIRLASERFQRRFNLLHTVCAVHSINGQLHQLFFAE